MDEREKYSIDLLTALAERTIKRLWVLIILLIILLFGTNAAWVYYENQFETVSVTQDVDSGEGDVRMTGVGDIYGESTPNG